MSAFVRAISVVCLCLSLVAAAGLILWDIAHGFSSLRIHSRAMAISLALVGASYAIAHTSGSMRVGEKIRAISLGGAFVLWGVEQFLPVGKLSAVFDCVLVVIFVVDLSLAVKKRLIRGESCRILP